ncbi:hypothetical protein ACFRQM_48795 [Streptomyces sp. NPDC056831]|uniref:hypothetical protein n=1 Tax=Streptomyces sp. NPDC056831 TaxID=3345954 RepID=UPI0036C32F49
MDELTARLRELDEEIGNLAVTRKTLLALPPAAPEPTEEPPNIGSSSVPPVAPTVVSTVGMLRILAVFASPVTLLISSVCEGGAVTKAMAGQWSIRTTAEFSMVSSFWFSD